MFEGQKKGKAFWNWLMGFVLPIWLVTTFVVQVAWVDGESMDPTLQHGDLVVLLKYPRWFQHFGWYQYQNGDILIFKAPTKSPYAHTQLWWGKHRGYNIKRVVGLAGEQLSIQDGVLFRNGITVQEPYISEGYMNDLTKETVASSAVWLLGDNRRQGSSIDSRMYGSVSYTDIAGPVVWRLWPRFGSLKVGEVGKTRAE